jgi:hypothetical protein
MKTLNVRGRKRDELTLEYFIGACDMLLAMGETKQANNLAGHAMLISARGYSWVQELAEKSNV